MDFKEAIEIIQDGVLFSNDELDEALELAYQSLEKQIPIKVGIYTNNYFKHCCSKCGTPAISDHERYCSECGQSIDWGEL